MDARALRDHEESISNRFAAYAQQVRQLFIEIKNEYPPKGALISLSEIDTTILILRQSFDVTTESGRRDYGIKLAALEQELLEECENHLFTGLEQLAEDAKRLLKKYRKACAKKPDYYKGGERGSPQSVVDECHRALDKLKKTAELKHKESARASLVSRPDRWDEHLNQYIAAIASYRSSISKMTALLEENKKSINDSVRVRLAYLGIVVAVILAMLGLFFGD